MPQRAVKFLTLMFALATTLALATPTHAQRFWQRFVPVDKVPADPNADYSLQQNAGPWLIMAAIPNEPVAR